MSDNTAAAAARGDPEGISELRGHRKLLIVGGWRKEGELRASRAGGKGGGG